MSDVANAYGEARIDYDLVAASIPVADLESSDVRMSFLPSETPREIREAYPLSFLAVEVV